MEIEEYRDPEEDWEDRFEAGADAEREKIVAWLRTLETWEGSPHNIAILNFIANAIYRGEHYKVT